MYVTSLIKTFWSGVKKKKVGDPLVYTQHIYIILCIPVIVFACIPDKLVIIASLVFMQCTRLNEPALDTRSPRELYRLYLIYVLT